MYRLSKFLIAAAMLVASSSASAEGVCGHAMDAAATASAAAMGVSTQAALVAAPVTAVTHSSGALILTGASGYVVNTLGFVAAAWAVATSPLTVALATGAVVAGIGAVATCRYLVDN